MVESEIREDDFQHVELIDVTSAALQKSYVLGIVDQHLRTAAGAALDAAHWRRGTGAEANGFLITDDYSRRGPRTIFVVDDAPGTCQQALQALLHQDIGGVASRFELDRLPAVLDAAASDLAAIPVRVIRSSAKLPKLEDRQRQVLELLATGISNTVIASRLHVSQATVKREVSELLQIFQASNRLELAMRGAEAGLVEITGSAQRGNGRGGPSSG